MEHSEAVQQMATERYLLDEMAAEERDAFEQHVFDCPECALDLRAGAAFVQEAKAQLPALTASSAEAGASGGRDWLGWLRPAFASPFIAGPAFASLLAVVAYQNLVLLPGLRTAASERQSETARLLAAAEGPRMAQIVSLRAETRDGSHRTIEAVHGRDLGLVMEIPAEPVFPVYSVELYDPEGKSVWTQNFPASAEPGSISSGEPNDRCSFVIPEAGLRAGAYRLALSGLGANGARAELESFTLEIHFNQ